MKCSRYNINYKLIFLTVIAQLCLMGAISAQDVKSLEKKYKSLQEEISILDRSLTKTLKDKNNTAHALSTISLQIKARANLISTLNKQLALLQDQITAQSKAIEQLSAQSRIMKIDYAHTLQRSQYSSNLLNKMLFVLSAPTANEIYKRIKYFSQVAAYLKLQAKQIQAHSDDASRKVEQLARSMKEKQRLFDDKNKEKINLAKSWKQKNAIVKQLNTQAAKLRANLDQKKKEQRELNARIQQAIKKELLKERERLARQKDKAKTPAQPKTTGAPKLLTGADLTNGFAKSKGHLPWPVTFGDVVEQFGTHPHPHLSKVTTYNIGINIKTIAGTKVNVVFPGKVLAVQLLYGTYAVIVQHGSYFTTYANLGTVLVKEGTHLRAHQQVGSAKTSKDGLAEIQFIVTNGTHNIDPEQWLVRR